jgi:deazaflavin-dependent oxidoreductase (nitroreductase family)
MNATVALPPVIDQPTAPVLAAAEPHYRAPGWVTRHVMNPVVALATRLGLSVWGSRVLQVRGRTSGELREVPVNLLTFDGADYLVAPRGVTQWVRNLRAAGEGRLRLGRRVEPFTSVELGDDEKEAVLRAYLKRWKAEVGVFFDGVDADSPAEELARIAPRHPVFRITRTVGA